MRFDTHQVRFLYRSDRCIGCCQAETDDKQEELQGFMGDRQYYESQIAQATPQRLFVVNDSILCCIQHRARESLQQRNKRSVSTRLSTRETLSGLLCG